MRSRLFARALAAVVPLVTLVVSPAFAQDIDAAAKWMELTVVHYRVVGEFSGTANIFGGSHIASAGGASGQVTDRIEIEFDWDQQEMKLVGKPVIRNFPTTIVALDPPGVPGCPASKVKGTFEFATVLALKDMTARIDLDIKRDHPAGSSPRRASEMGTAPCGHAWDETAPASGTVSDTSFRIPHPMFLAMPVEGADPPMVVTKDGKSIVVKDKGWTWTFTPTPGK